MSDLLHALGVAHDEFDRRIRQVGDADWHLPTPCTDWDVYALVNHVVVGGSRYGKLIRGGTREAFLAERDLDALVDGALPAWESARALCESAFAEPGALQRTAAFATGDIPGAALLAIRLVEVTVHTWDLARALGLDESFDAGLSAVALEAWPALGLPREARGLSFFDAPTGGAGSSDLQTLLRLTGREP